MTFGCRRSNGFSGLCKASPQLDKKKGRQVGRRHDSVFAVSLSVIFATLQYAVFGGGHTGDAEESSFWRNIVSPVWNHCKPFLCLDDEGPSSSSQKIGLSVGGIFEVTQRKGHCKSAKRRFKIIDVDEVSIPGVSGVCLLVDIA